MRTLFETNMDMEQPEFFTAEDPKYRPVINKWVFRNAPYNNLYYRVRLEGDDEEYNVSMILNLRPYTRATGELPTDFDFYFNVGRVVRNAQGHHDIIYAMDGFDTQGNRLYGPVSEEEFVAHFDGLLEKLSWKVYIPPDLREDIKERAVAYVKGQGFIK